MNGCDCQNCKHYDHEEECCWSARDIFFTEDEHCCICWEEEVELTEEERYDGGVMSNFDNENPKEVEDYINEGRGKE